MNKLYTLITYSTRSGNVTTIHTTLDDLISEVDQCDSCYLQMVKNSWEEQTGEEWPEDQAGLFGKFVERFPSECGWTFEESEESSVDVVTHLLSISVHTFNGTGYDTEDC